MYNVTLAVTVSTLAMTVGAITAPPASAASPVTRTTITTPFTESGIPDDCRPGITGDITGTQVLDLQVVPTASGVHLNGFDTGTGRIDWNDGSYSLVGSIDRFSSHDGPRKTVYTDAHQDAGNTYSADGTFLFRGTLHSVEQFTVEDGVITNIWRGHFHFFGDC